MRTDAEAGAPRFALRFEGGRGMLALARPLRFAFGSVEVLELSLGALRFPLDLSAGAARFRTRRTRLCAAAVRVDLAALLADRVEEPYRIAPLAQREDGASFALTDPFGTVAFDVHAAAEGPDLWLAIASARSALEGPAPPTIRVLAALRALGLELDEDRGAIPIRRVLSAALLDALVPRGWRVPEDRSVRLGIDVLGRHVLLRTLEEGEPEPAIDPGPWERARRLAPITISLARGDGEEARRRWEITRERVGGGSAALAREAEALGVSPPGEVATDPLSLTLALRRGVREGRVAQAVESARRLAEIEPCDAIAVEALCTAADLSFDRAPEIGAELLERAAARRARDPRIALRLLEALARLPSHARLRAAADAALTSREPGPERAELAREAASICLLADRHDEAGRLFRIAAEGLPNDARVLEGLAAAEARAARYADALRLCDRAAEAFLAEGNEDAVSRALRRAATMAERLGRAEIVEERLARAAERAPHDADVWAQLAAVRRDHGGALSALRAEDRLLASLEAVAPGRASVAVADALARAAEAALDHDELERARTFTAALARARSEHPALASLSATIDAVSPGERSLDEILEEPPTEGMPRARAVEIEAASSGERSLAERGGAEPPIERTPDVHEVPPRSGDDGTEESEGGSSFLDRARLAARERDSAGLRAALNGAERAGDLESARRIVELALTIVGDGPARRALEATHDRLSSR